MTEPTFPAMTARQVFIEDCARFHKMFSEAEAIVTAPDGFTYIDETKVAAEISSAYRSLMQYAYANGLA